MRWHSVCATLCKGPRLLHRWGPRRLLSSTESTVPLGAPSLARLQDAASAVLRRKQQNIPPLSQSFPEHPLVLNLEALSQVWSGGDVDVDAAIATQSRVVHLFESRVGVNSDDFVDLAGSLNDLACLRLCHPRNTDLDRLVSSERTLKRSIQMSQRAYRVNGHVMACLTANLMETQRLGGKDRADSALQLAQRVMQQVNAPAPGSSASASKPDPLADVTSSSWSAYRLVQLRLMAARCVFLLQSPEEGLILFNSSLAHLSADTVLPLDLKRILCATALVDLVQMRRQALATRRKDVSSSHLQQDHLQYFLAIMMVASADPPIRVCTLASPLDEVESALASLMPHLPDVPSVRRYVGVDLLAEDAHRLAPRHAVGLSLLDARFYCAREGGDGGQNGTL